MQETLRSLLARSLPRYALAAAVISVSILLQATLVRHLGHSLPPFLLAYPAVMLVAILAGFRAGLLATALAVAGADFFFLPPFRLFAVRNGSDLVALAIFALMGALVSLLAERYRRSQRRERIHESHRRLAEVMHGSFDAIMVLGLDGGVQSWNHGAGHLYGFGEDDVLGRDPHLLLHTEPAIPWSEVVATLRKQNTWERELHQTTKNGRVVAVATRYQLITGPDGNERILKIGRDITDRKLAEKHIQQLNRVYAVLSDVNQTIVREKTPQAMLQAACRIAVEKGEFGMAWVGMLDPSAQMVTPVAWHGAVDGYLDDLKLNLLNPDQNGGPAALCARTGNRTICNNIAHYLTCEHYRERALRRGFRSSGSFPLGVDGKLVGVLSLYSSQLDFFEEDELKLLDEMAMDIGYALEVSRSEEERRKAGEELRWRTAFFEALVDSSPDGILVVDDHGRKILQNRRMNEMLKIPPQIAENPDDARQLQFAAQLMKRPDEFIEKVKHLNAHRDEVCRDEIELLDGTILDRYTSPVRDKTQHYYGRIWGFRDITGQRQLEEQYRQAQKMEAIGQLTGGIAHDFNNLLTVVLGCSEVIGEEARENPRLGKMADMILAAGRRGTDLTHRMLAFARRQTLQPRPVDINRMLTEMEDFLRHTLSAEIELEIVPSRQQCVAIVDPARLENALLNLCLNAQDAMPRGGTLTIESQHTVLDAAYAERNAEVVPGEYILIAVSDTGSGIDPENLKRVFEPFFTTKEVGKGTGLGLSMVYGFVKQSRGHIKIYSEPGRGASVKLYLPHSPQSGEITDLGPLSVEELRGSELILLVEDDDPVREYARLQLESLGYRVVEAANGSSALDIVASRSNIDLLFTDMVMPGKLNGYELAREARKLNPRLKVLYCSGYAENALQHHGLLDKNAEMLDKPYTRQELSKKVREALAKPLNTP